MKPRPKIVFLCVCTFCKSIIFSDLFDYTIFTSFSELSFAVISTLLDGLSTAWISSKNSSSASSGFSVGLCFYLVFFKCFTRFSVGFLWDTEEKSTKILMIFYSATIATQYKHSRSESVPNFIRSPNGSANQTSSSNATSCILPISCLSSERVAGRV